MLNCIVCNKKLIGTQTTFCSRLCSNHSTNRKFNDYAAQKKRATGRKLKLIELLGGKCCICGYSKNTSALHFHHKDPKQKLFNLDSRKLSNSTWEDCVTESQKCLLLCANCHHEIHHPQCLLHVESPALSR